MITDKEKKGPFRVVGDKRLDDLCGQIESHYGMGSAIWYKEDGNIIVQCSQNHNGKWGKEFEFQEKENIDLKVFEGERLERMQQGQKFPRKKMYS